MGTSSSKSGDKQRKGPQRRSSDVGVQKSGGLGSGAGGSVGVLGVNNFVGNKNQPQMSGWDDHDVKNIRNLHIDPDYFGKPAAHTRPTRSSSQTQGLA